LTEEGCNPQQVTFRHQLELRYVGQSATITIEWHAGAAHEETFHAAHLTASGLKLEHPVELVNIRLSARAPAVLESIDIPHSQGEEHGIEMIRLPGIEADVALRSRRSLARGEEVHGPCILTEQVATSWIKPGWVVSPDEWGNLFLERQARA
jgi:N-methylhydantoinase A